MDGETVFCDACHSIGYEINAYYESFKASLDNEDQRSRSPWELGKPTTVSLGTWKDLQSRLACSSCQIIARRLVCDGKEPPAPVVLNFESDRDQGLYIRGGSWLDRSYLQLWGLEDSNEPLEIGRSFSPHQINIDLLHQWIRCCHTSHGEHCHSVELRIPFRQIYVIDVEEGCLVSVKMETRYIALSYVWGNTETLQTIKSNLMHLKKPRSIDANLGGLKIGNTIKDALRLVSLLGERYLWVDCLCIVQDDLDTKQVYLNAMGSIYANAYFTIVAADGHNADHGLRGLGQGSRDRAIRCDIVRFPYNSDVVIHRPRAWYPEDSPWESRAWTFQEALYSRRILIFNGTVSWFCRTALWQEHVKSPTEDVAYAVNHEPHPYRLHLAARNPTWPDLGSWGEMVEEFNKRKLTFDKDVIDAFAGITSAFNNHFSGGILWGIPEIFFDHCMVWKPKDVLRRRRAYNHALSEDTLPSRSWVAWEGDVVPVGAPLILVDHPKLDAQSINIQPLAQWYKSKEPMSPLENIGLSLQLNLNKSQSEQLSTGWTQGQYSDGTYYYTHETVPTVRFRYPIPLANENASALQQFNENGRYLHFKSQRARLSLGRELTDDLFNLTNCAGCLVDNEGNWAGTIRINASRFDSLPKGQSCELIALSLATAVNSGDYLGILDEWKLPERPRDTELYQFYYVMWIEWERGIAYRKAVGTVYKPVWENQVREDLDVILG